MEKVNAQQLKQTKDKNTTLLLDVRTPVEFAEMHIPDSKPIPLNQLEKEASQLDSAQHHTLICRSGKRAEQAHDILSKKGFQKLSILDGGVLAWEAAQHPLNRSERKVLPLMRQVQLVIGLGVLTFSLLAFFVHPVFAFGSAFFGAGLTMAGATGWCGLAVLLSKMPWNKVSVPTGTTSCCVPN